jgi:hypothetical protein
LTITETKLKEITKAAVAEALVEQRNFLKGVVEEVIEEIALAKAIERGLETEAVGRAEVFAVFDSSEI